MTSLLHLPPNERPRERLFTQGATLLSDGDLLAVLLGTGGAGTSVLDLSRGLLARFGDLTALAGASSHELECLPGIGQARAGVLQAAFELGRRAAGARPRRGQRLGRASEVWAHLRARLGSRPTEEFWVLGLDARHRLQHEECAARGSLTGVEVHPRDVFRPLIRAGVAAVIFCHNHPSGDPSPSREDIELTTRLREVGALCGISVLDHVVVAADGFVSLAEQGWL